MEELLVITACLYQKGCGESASTLYSQRPQLREFVTKTEADIKRTAGPVVTDYMAPVVFVAAGGTGVMRLSEKVGVKYSRDKVELVFKKEF